MKVIKEGHFEAAHMLSYYSGRCNNLHGHSYKYRITFTADVVNDMVIDFRDIAHSIDVRFDHVIIFASNEAMSSAERELLDWARKYNKSYLQLEKGRPTAENIAEYIAQLPFELWDGLFEVKVELWETESSCVVAEVKQCE